MDTLNDIYKYYFVNVCIGICLIVKTVFVLLTLVNIIVKLQL